jgi:hypothetical protein
MRAAARCLFQRQYEHLTDLLIADPMGRARLRSVISVPLAKKPAAPLACSYKTFGCKR